MKNRKALLLMTMLSMVFAVIMPTSIYALDPETNQETGGTTPSPTPSPSPSEKPTPSPSPSESPVTKTISLDKTSLELGTNKSITLVAIVTPSGSEIEWSSSDEEVAKVSENGKVTTLSKAGTTTITATIKGTTIKASCTIKVTKAVGSDATLKKLVISNGTLDKEFKSDVYNYSVTLDTSVNKLEFTYELSDSNASYFGPSSSVNKNLKNGDKLELKVIAEDGTTNHTYTLTIVKDASNLNLKSLKINGYALNEVFDYNTLHYTASIPYEVDTITVAANPIDNAANVDITGLTNLKVGENTVTITVSDKAGKSKKYTIIVTRESKKTVSENPTSIITSTSSNPTSSIINSNSNNKSDDSFLKYLIVSIACLILFLIGGIGIYFYMKTSPKRIKNELKNLNNEKKQQESPILEVGNEKQEALKEVMNEDLMKTKEFSKEELIDKEETENLFDEEDV